jgi:hypothetical protein
VDYREARGMKQWKEEDAQQLEPLKLLQLELFVEVIGTETL